MAKTAQTKKNDTTQNNQKKNFSIDRPTFQWLVKESVYTPAPDMRYAAMRWVVYKQDISYFSAEVGSFQVVRVSSNVSQSK